MSVLISNRSEFTAVTSSEVQSPTSIPRRYAWMTKGTFFVFNGRMIEGTAADASEWGLEINYVNDFSKDGKPSALGFTVFFARGEYFQNWLSWPTLFPHFFNLKSLGHEEVAIDLGVFPCLKVIRGPENYCGVNKYMWYHDQLGCLIKMEVKSIDDSKSFYECSLVEASHNATELLARYSTRTAAAGGDIATEGGPVSSLPPTPNLTKQLAIAELDSLRAYPPQTDARLQDDSQHAMEWNLERQRKNDAYQRELLAWKKLPLLKRFTTPRPRKAN